MHDCTFKWSWKSVREIVHSLWSIQNVVNYWWGMLQGPGTIRGIVKEMKMVLSSEYFFLVADKCCIKNYALPIKT